MTTLTLLVLVVVAALVFDFINGFHDTANAIATVVSTGVLKARTAVLMAAVLNTAGAFLGTAVAQTIGKGIIDPSLVTQQLVLAALLSAIVWNLVTWYFGIPSSSSHALVGGIVGAGGYTLGLSAIKPAGVEKVVTALIVSPFFGFFAAFTLMVATYWITRRVRPVKINAASRKLQLLSSGFMAISHGQADAQKTMGVIALALASYHGTSMDEIPLWVVLSCAVAMGAGTAAGGWRIIHTMGSKIFKLRPIHGFCAETGAAVVLLTASHFGLPTSTTHCITSSIMGAGATTRLSAVSWGVTRRIVGAWILTIPVCAALGAAFVELLRVAGIG
jgi:PiT family inorganic phosphate transporter